MSGMDPQSLPLRDIHLPSEPISWWPLAPGWWILLGLFCLLILAIFLLRRWIIKQRKMPKRVALRGLEKLQRDYQQHHNPQTLIQGVSILLRRFFITEYSRTQVASLTGEAWLQFLDQQLGKPQFTQGEGRCLIEAPYQAHVKFEVETLLKICHSIITNQAVKKPG
jgi:hypothetical protein